MGAVLISVQCSRVNLSIAYNAVDFIKPTYIYAGNPIKFRMIRDNDPFFGAFQ